MLKLRMISLAAILIISGCGEEKHSYAPPPESAACKALQREIDGMQEARKTMSKDEWSAWLDGFQERKKEKLSKDEFCLISGDSEGF